MLGVRGAADVRPVQRRRAAAVASRRRQKHPLFQNLRETPKEIVKIYEEPQPLSQKITNFSAEKE